MTSSVMSAYYFSGLTTDAHARSFHSIPTVIETIRSSFGHIITGSYLNTPLS